MYSASALKDAVENPHLVLTELNRVFHQRVGKRQQNPNGVNIFSLDWDNLIILDACRYDIFKEAISEVDIDGDLHTKTSLGSATREWVTANFSGVELHDTVYIDANGYYARLKEQIGASVHRYEMVDNDAFGGISAKPETVTDDAIAAAAEYPNKRLLVHYMQPHQPFFGATGDQIQHSEGFEKTVRENSLSQEEWVSAYRENLELALKSVERLVAQLDGKTVISADHGELLGDRQSPIPTRYYGHPAGLYVPELVNVPWLIHEAGERRDIRSGKPESDDIGLDSGELDDRLRDLGYL